MILNKFSDFYKRFEKWISPVGLIYGFIFTSLTLTRVDMWLENFWIVVHLLIAGFGILALTFYENRVEKPTPAPSQGRGSLSPSLGGGFRRGNEKEKFYFYLTLIIQFAFGNLFATFFVFYWRSLSLSHSWFFVLILLK